MVLTTNVITLISLMQEAAEKFPEVEFVVEPSTYYKCTFFFLRHSKKREFNALYLAVYKHNKTTRIVYRYYPVFEKINFHEYMRNVIFPQCPFIETYGDFEELYVPKHEKSIIPL